jgi:TIR domain
MPQNNVGHSLGEVEIFISFSGNNSKKVAELIYEYLPLLIQSTKPLISIEDIKKGALWPNELMTLLIESKFGIICVTQDNINNPWLLFEAGAIAKSANLSVYTLLLGCDPQALKGGPLEFFQATIADDKDDFKRLLHEINKKLDKKIEERNLDRLFNMLWTDIFTQLKSIKPPKA